MGYDGTSPPDSAGKGGTTTSGNTSRELLHCPVNREIILADTGASEDTVISLGAKLICYTPCALFFKTC